MKAIILSRKRALDEATAASDGITSLTLDTVLAQAAEAADTSGFFQRWSVSTKRTPGVTPRKRPVRAIAMTFAVLLPLVVVAPPASASTASDVSIFTYCANSDTKPQGMWYSADNGQSGWATWGAGDPGQGAQWFTFHLNSTITNVNLSIGCGGTPQSWKKVMTGAVAVFKVPSQRFTANCSGPGYACQLINS